MQAGGDTLRLSHSRLLNIVSYDKYKVVDIADPWKEGRLLHRYILVADPTASHLPEGTTYQQIMAVGILCGIGFTMSIFIASLAFGSVDPELINWAKLGILVGSISSAVIGYSWLRVRLRPSV